MGNNARKIRKAGKRTPRKGRYGGLAAVAKRSPERESERKERRSDAAANPRKTFERYVALAREAASSGDAIQSENYYQYAEHYLRQMAPSQAARHDGAVRE